MERNFRKVTVVIAGGEIHHMKLQIQVLDLCQMVVYAYWDSAHIGGPTNTGGAKLGSASSVGLTNANLTSSQKILSYKLLVMASRPDAYFRTIGVTAPNRIGIAKTAGDPDITSDQYVFIVGKALDVQYTVDSGPTGIVTF